MRSQTCSLLTDPFQGLITTEPRRITVPEKQALPDSICLQMNPSQDLTLTSRNAAALCEYAELVGMTPGEFLNTFLTDLLVVRFSDP